jgi:hypothetical protein
MRYMETSAWTRPTRNQGVHFPGVRLADQRCCNTARIRKLDADQFSADLFLPHKPEHIT